MENNQPDPQVSVSEKKGSKKWIILFVILVVISGVYFFFMSGGPTEYKSTKFGYAFIYDKASFELVEEGASNVELYTKDENVGTCAEHISIRTDSADNIQKLYDGLATMITGAAVIDIIVDGKDGEKLSGTDSNNCSSILIKIDADTGSYFINIISLDSSEVDEFLKSFRFL